MANYSQLKAAIADVIKTNGTQAITGQVLQDVLNSMVSVIGANYTFAGVATPATNPSTPDQNVVYLASQAGTYTNFGGIELPAGISLLMWNGTWGSQIFFRIDDEPTAGSNNLVTSGGASLFDDTFRLIGKNDSTAFFRVKCIKNHRYRIYLDNTTPDLTGVTTSSADVVLLRFTNYNINFVNGIILYMRGTNEKVSPFQSFYDVVAQQDGIIQVSMRMTEGEEVNFKVVDITQADNILIREKNISSDILSTTKINYAINRETLKWINNYGCYLIQLTNKDKTLIIQSNSINTSYITFLKSGFSNYGDYVDMSEYCYSITEIPAIEEIEVLIPEDAKYLYIYAGTNNEYFPQKLIISEETTDRFSGITLNYSTKLENKFIDSSFELHTLTNIVLYEFDVSNVDVVGIHARFGLHSYEVFYDDNDNIVGYFQSALSSGSQLEYDFNDVMIVPEGATKLKFSSVKNLGISVKNCVHLSKKEPRNLLNCKKVAFIGDSITYGYGLTDVETERWTAIFSRELARCVEINLGYSGTCIANNAKVDAEKNANRFITRATQANIGDADVIFVFGSVNDFTADSKPIGDLFTEIDITPSEYRGSKKRVSNGDTDTFSGALHELLNQIQTINKTAKVIYINILNKGLTAAGRPTGIDQNSNGDYLQDFNKTIDTICDFYGVPVVPLNGLFGQNWNYDDNTANPPVLHSMDADGVHPNALGHRRIAEVVFEYIVNNKLI